MTRHVVLAAAAVLVAMTVGCGNQPSTANSAPNPATTVQMTEFEFIPVDLTVPANSTLTLQNVGVMAHSYLLRGQGIGTGEILPGKSGKLILAGVAPGKYQTYCDQPGHAAAGEIGTLTIAP